LLYLFKCPFTVRSVDGDAKGFWKWGKGRCHPRFRVNPQMFDHGCQGTGCSLNPPLLLVVGRSTHAYPSGLFSLGLPPRTKSAGFRWSTCSETWHRGTCLSYSEVVCSGVLRPAFCLGVKKRAYWGSSTSGAHPLWLLDCSFTEQMRFFHWIPATLKWQQY